jgi:DNA (cytosine-5)-methyltransferase 1
MPRKTTTAKRAGRKSSNTVKVLEETASYQTSGTSMSDPLRFIDLFCGIGGFRIAFEGVGGKCVFSSDYDKFINPAIKY